MTRAPNCYVLPLVIDALAAADFTVPRARLRDHRLSAPHDHF